MEALAERLGERTSDYSIKKLFQCSSRILSKGHGKEFLTSGYSMSLTGVYCIKANLDTKQIN